MKVKPPLTDQSSFAPAQAELNAFREAGLPGGDYRTTPVNADADLDVIEKVIDMARQHGEDTEPDREVGDLRDLVRDLWGRLTPGQKRDFLATSEALDNLKGSLGVAGTAGTPYWFEFLPDDGGRTSGHAKDPNDLVLLLIGLAPDADELRRALGITAHAAVEALKPGDHRDVNLPHGRLYFGRAEDE